MTPEEIVLAALKAADGPADLVGLSKDEFLKALAEGADALDEFNKGVAEATKRLNDKAPDA